MNALWVAPATQSMPERAPGVVQCPRGVNRALVRTARTIRVSTHRFSLRFVAAGRARGGGCCRQRRAGGRARGGSRPVLVPLSTPLYGKKGY